MLDHEFKVVVGFVEFIPEEKIRLKREIVRVEGVSGNYKDGLERAGNPSASIYA